MSKIFAIITIVILVVLAFIFKLKYGIEISHLLFSIAALAFSLCLAFGNELNEEYIKKLTMTNLIKIILLVFSIFLSYFFYECKGNNGPEPFINAFSSTLIMISLFVFSAISKFKSK